ncbi:ester cyclase [Paraburkholderia bengalensis]|uniref:Ester cyclase n=1 Tax=Paraburkholderia bengalensis TaxID=2747562 RepID=A0ABU8J6K2_9BURK
MSIRPAVSLCRLLSAAGLALASLAAASAFAVSPAAAGHASNAAALVQPQQLTVDRSLPKAQRDAQILAARRYDTFWNTGDESLARAALAHDFTDRTLPPGRAQGIEGPLAASKFVRGAVPDMQAQIEQMVVAGDHVIVHLRFQGHFTGQFKGVQGHGQNVDFIATDIYRIKDGRIADNWHLEDNLTFLQQLGAVAN